MLGLGALESEISFQHYAQGTMGEFNTPAGRVSYLMTKARLGADGTDPERRLTQNLIPVREVLPAKDMDFNQLLQRDLDDHRVAVSLVPYLLKPDANGPAFFPPVVAIALPFSLQQPSEFPDLVSEGVVPGDLGLNWRRESAGQHFRVERFATADGGAAPINLGRVSWNSEYCKIVVVDGQHRSMALLAIDRTIRGTWESSNAAKYRYFYESRIREALGPEGQVPEVEIPVTILWFPDFFGEGKFPHKVARKLFVDVNKEARKPSESRLILLSDGELVNIFTRSMLTLLRNESATGMVPLYSVEYDNPDTKTTQAARWSALTNVHSLKQMVNRAIFGPSKYVSNLAISIGSREAEGEKDAFMREQLDVESLFPLVLEGPESFRRDDLGNKDFPDAAVQPLTSRFTESWGRALMSLLGGIRPWAAHARALAVLNDTWMDADAPSSLAREALFSGVGMYWTLQDSETHWKNELALHPGSARPDVVKAWQLIALKQSEFEQERALQFMGSAARVGVTNAVFQAMNTQACQLGLALTAASLAHYAKLDHTQIVELAARMTAGVNAYMESKPSGDYDRRTVFAKRRGDAGPRSPLNLITNMDTPRAVQFRYFWLEILCSSPSAPHLEPLVTTDVVSQLRDQARMAYLQYIASEKSKALKTAKPLLTDAERSKEAESAAAEEIKSALNHWFGIRGVEFDAWLSSVSTLVVKQDLVDEDEADGELDDGNGDPEEVDEVDF